MYRRFGVHRGERVDPSSGVDLLRYQEDRTIEEGIGYLRRTPRVSFSTPVRLRVIDKALLVSFINMS